MATNVEYATEQGPTAFDVAKGFYSFSTLMALTRIPTKGFEVPWTGGVGGTVNLATSQFAKFGIGTPTALNTTLRVGGPIRSAGIRKLGFFGAAGHLARGKAPVVARRAMAKLMISKAAGAGMGLIYFELAMLPLQLGWAGYSAVAEAIKTHKGLELGGYFPESRGSMTSRQRTVRAITDSRLQARSVIGQEAMLMHR